MQSEHTGGADGGDGTARFDERGALQFLTAMDYGHTGKTELLCVFEHESPILVVHGEHTYNAPSWADGRAVHETREARKSAPEEFDAGKTKHSIEVYLFENGKLVDCRQDADPPSDSSGPWNDSRLIEEACETAADEARAAFATLTPPTPSARPSPPADPRSPD